MPVILPVDRLDEWLAAEPTGAAPLIGPAPEDARRDRREQARQLREERRSGVRGAGGARRGTDAAVSFLGCGCITATSLRDPQPSGISDIRNEHCGRVRSRAVLSDVCARTSRYPRAEAHRPNAGTALAAVAGWLLAIVVQCTQTERTET